MKFIYFFCSISDEPNKSFGDIRSFIGKGNTVGTTKPYNNSALNGKVSALFSSIGSSSADQSSKTETGKEYTIINGVLKKIDRSLINSKPTVLQDVSKRQSYLTDSFEKSKPKSSSNNDNQQKLNRDFGPSTSKSLDSPGKDSFVDLTQDRSFKHSKKKSGSFFKKGASGKKKLSVCIDPKKVVEDDIFKKTKVKKVKKKYVFDELDDDEGLWEESCSKSRINDCGEKSPLINKNVTPVKIHPNDKFVNKKSPKMDKDDYDIHKNQHPRLSNDSSVNVNTTSTSTEHKTNPSGYVLGGASGGQSYLAKIRKTFVKNPESSFPSVQLNRDKRKSNEAFKYDSEDDDVYSASIKKSRLPSPEPPAQLSASNNLPDSPPTVFCPCCCSEVLESLINEHLDTCLS